MKKLTDFRKTVDLRLDFVSLLAVISNSSNLLGSMACLLLYPCASQQSRRGFYTSIRDHQPSHVTTTHGMLSCPLFKVLQCMYWSSSQHEWRNNLVFYVFFFFFFFVFFLGDAQSATERNPSEMEAFSGSFPDYLWEKVSCVYTCGVFVSCAQLPLTC